VSLCFNWCSVYQELTLIFTSVMRFVGYDYVKKVSELNGVLEEEPGDL